MTTLRNENSMILKRKALGAALLAASMMVVGPAFAEEPEDVPAEEVAEVVDDMTAVPADDEVAEMPGLDPDEEEEADIEDELDRLLGEDESESRPWSVSGSTRMSVGQGTFVQLANDSQWAGEVHDGSGAYNRVSMSFGVSPSYRWNDFTFGASIGFSQNLTAHGMNRPYETRFQDIGLSAGWSGYTFEQIGVSIRPSIGLSLPASARSQATTLRLGTSAGLSVSKSFFGSLTLSYSLRGSRSFYEYTSPVMSVQRVGEENAIYRLNGEEAVEPGRFAVAGVNTPWGLSNSLGASFRVGKVGLTVGYTYTRRWSYDWTEQDEFTSERQCVGRCVGDGMSGNIGMSYSLNDWLSMSGGLSSGGLPKTMDQRSYNFPFWNFNGAAANSSSISLGLSARY